MFQISILRDGIKTHGTTSENVDLANTWIQKHESKPSHPWGRPAGLYRLLSDTSIEFQGEKQINPDEILERRPVEDWPLGEVLLDRDYIVDIIDLDSDTTLSERGVKYQKKLIRLVKQEFLFKPIDERYSDPELDIINMKAINVIAKALNVQASLPAQFNNAFDDIKGFSIDTGDKIAALRACTTVGEMNQLCKSWGLNVSV